MTDLPPEIEPIVLKVLEKRVAEADDAARAAIGSRYPEGVSRKIRSPLDDAVLGVVGRESPNPKWVVTDRAALCKALEADPDNIEYVYDIAGTDDQVIDVLSVHAPHLLARIERVRPEAISAAVAAAARGETPLPGIKRVKPAGRLYVRPDKAAGPAIERLVQAGYLSWDGRLLELPAADTHHTNENTTEASA